MYKEKHWFGLVASVFQGMDTWPHCILSMPWTCVMTEACITSVAYFIAVRK